METTMDVTPREVLDIHQAGQRSGFIAGVAFCVGVKYIWDRRKRLNELYQEGRLR